MKYFANLICLLDEKNKIIPLDLTVLSEGVEAQNSIL